VAEKVRAFCFPSTDLVFAARVGELLEPPDQEPLWAAVEATLRDTYPLALISPRMGSAALDTAKVWHVYRDGTSLGSVSPDDA
jgi:hypothetical protein